MSDKKNLERKLAASESRWEAVQLTAANAQKELDYAIAVFEKHKDELTTEQLQSTMAQIDEQKNNIKSYLMRGYTVHNQNVIRLTKALERLEKENA